MNFELQDYLYYGVGSLIAIFVLVGIALMRQVKTARLGNLINALASLLAIGLVIYYSNIYSNQAVIITIVSSLLVAAGIGTWIAYKVKMIQMPELVGLLNGIGGAASAIIGAVTIFHQNNFELITAVLALIVGTITLIGSLIASGKLANLIAGHPIVWRKHNFISIALLIGILASIILALFVPEQKILILVLACVFSALFGYVFVIRVGGADMPVTISLLNSLSGLAGALAGLALSDVVLITIGAIIGSSGLVLTQIMSHAMNRSIKDILLGTGLKQSISNEHDYGEADDDGLIEDAIIIDNQAIINAAQTIIIVPGYGMALAQAQVLVEKLTNALEKRGKEVIFAIHPVAGRMPGHMNILLAEVGIDYEKLREMDDINPQFQSTDLVIVVGANDVINPASREAVGTPIYGMPILDVDQAKHVIICNYDKKPGYSGIENPLYYEAKNVSLLLGDAKESVQKLIDLLK